MFQTLFPRSDQDLEHTSQPHFLASPHASVLMNLRRYISSPLQGHGLA